jgi:DMSO reductase family type II enzyme chaperone
MNTPAETQESQRGHWAPESNGPNRSLFANYHAGADQLVAAGEPACSAPETLPLAGNLQAAIDSAVARSFIYQLLARAFADPEPDLWAVLSNPETHTGLDGAVAGLGPDQPRLKESAGQLRLALQPSGFEAFFSAHLSAFGHAARGACPINEIEYSELKADALFQPHRLADLAAFYRAFGLELAPDADERHDHLCLELEFMCVLAAKEAYALEHQLAEELTICREAEKNFLRAHLARWTPAFARRLGQMVAGTPLAAVAAFTEAWIAAECALFNISPGSHELSLRPVDEAAESLCASCSLNSSPPGALPLATEA